jgi:uncharacterized protein YggE
MEGTIRVTASASSVITAKAVKLHVKLEGERAVFGSAALTQAKELKDLVERLKALGLEEAQISVTAVTMTNPASLLKTSKVTFKLEIAESKLERIPSVLGALSDTKNLEVQHLEWVWDDFETSVPLATEAMRKAKRKAEAMASGVGATVTGIRNASDSWNMPESVVMYDSSAPKMMRSRSAPPVDIGMEYRATQTLEVSVTADFAVRND